MKKKLWIIIALTAALCIGGVALLVGGNQTDAPRITPENTEAAPQIEVDPADLESAIEYIRAFYKNAPEKTTADYKRIGTVRVGLQSYTVVWTVDVAEEHVKVVVNEDGSVTIDVNENSEDEVAYVLTATVTDAAGNSRSTSWNHILPGVIDEEMLAIVDMAYALEEGQSLPSAVTLRGIITSIDTPYDSSYKNISVVMAVPGREDKPILCYRLKGEGADALAVGDTITVTGIIKNYKGTIEFDAGCTLDSVVKGDNAPIEAPEDPAEIMKQAYALAPGQSLPYTATLTGTITSVDEAFSSTYNNITVTMKVKDGGGYSIKCYRMKGTGIDTLNVNDIITVTGQIKNYNGTIEFNFPNLDSVIQMEPPKQPSDPKAVVDAAYNLDPYASLPYTATLTGKVTDIKYRWSEQYPSVSLTMVVEGRENKPLYCYSMTGDGMKTVEIGDTVTVKGMIKNYYNTETGTSTIEYDHPTLVKLVKNTAVAPDDPKQIVDEAFALEKGEILDYKATLTGKIVSIDTPYDSGYKNITVSIQVEGSDGMKKLKCYRLAGTGASGLEVGDTITVTGNIKNYNGTIEFDQGCTLDKVVKGDDEDKPVAPEDPKQIVDEAFALEPNESLPYEAVLTGEIVSIDTPYDSGYKNITVSIEVEGSEGMKTLKCYRLKGDGAADLKIGDTITVKGTITHYYNSEKEYGEIEYAAGCQLVSTDSGESDTTVVPEVEVTPVAHKDLVAETAYKFFVEQKGLNQVLYFAGSTNSSGYLATTENAAEAADVYMEEAEGGVRFYFLDGETKTYIEIYLNDEAKPRPKLSTEPSAVYSYDEETGLYVAALGENKYYYGTYGTYNTLSTSSTWYITGDNAANVGATQFVAQFGIHNGKVEDPEEPVVPEIQVTPVEHKDLKAETAYKFYLEQKNLDKILYFNGTTNSGGYLASTETAEEAADVYMEEAEGGVRFYFLDGETKTYIEIYLNDAGKPRPKLSTEPTGVYTYDEATALYVVELNGNKYYYGTYNDFDTFSTSSTWYITGDNAVNRDKTQFVAQFGLFGEDDPTVLDTPEKIVNAAYTLETGASLEGTYTLTGVVTEINTPFSQQYQNISVVIVVKEMTDKPILCFRIKGEGADTLAVGDTITVTGTLTNYNGTIEYAAGGSLDAVVKGDTETPVKPENPKDIVDAAFALEQGQSLPYEATLTGAITEIVNAYSEQYKNITVNMAVEGNDGEKSIQCFRLKGEGAEALAVGDIITVTGVIKNYNGTVEFNSGCSLDAVQKPDSECQHENLVHMEAVSAGCHMTGNIEHWYCTDCETVWQDEALTQITNHLNVIIPALGGPTNYVAAVTPSCYAEGNIEYWYCTICGQVWQDEALTQLTNNKNVILPATHQNIVHVEAVAASCFAEGKAEHWYCSDCNTVWADEAMLQITNHLNVIIPATHQNIVHAEAVAPGCHYTGNAEHWYCADCDTVWADEAMLQITNHLNVIIPAVGGEVTHVAAVAPTETENGNIEYWVCESCEQVWQDAALTQLTNIKNVVLPATGEAEKPADPAEKAKLTIEEAIALGASMEHNTYTEEKYYVTGLIKEVYNTQYGNMILVDEACNELTIYGTYSADGETRYDALEVKPVAGDTVTIYGFIGQYSDKPQIKNGWITEHIPAEEETPEEPSEPEEGVLDTPEKIVNAAYELAAGEALEEEYTLTGIITEIDSPYSQQYKNISVVIVVGDMEDKPILCYRIKGDGADALAVGDTITVTGELINYNGTIEFSAGGSLDAVVKGENEAVVAPSNSRDIVDAAFALEVGESLPYEATLSGFVTEIVSEYSESYQNITVNMSVWGNDGRQIIQCFRMKGDGAADLVVDDYITVTGSIKNYNGTIEFDSGCSLILVEKDEPVETG